jgi:hypothetical protein
MKPLAFSPLLAASVTASALVLSGCGDGSNDSALNNASAATPVTPAMSKFLPTLRESAPGLDGYTVYRPADLSAVGGTVPVLLWGNGACKSSNHQYWDILGAISARGYVVVAYGAAGQVTFTESNTVTPSRMQKSLDWVVSQAKSKPGYELIDTSKIGVFGTSCGGLEALLAAADSRVKTVVGMNTGFFDAGSAGSVSTGGYSVSDISKLHTPTLFVGGGPSDIAFAQTHSNFNASNVPTVMAENPEGGHSGLWAGLRYTLSPTNPAVATGSTVDYIITEESLEGVVRWFDYTLNGNTAERAYFAGTGCGWCQVKGWTVTTKNF